MPWPFVGLGLSTWCECRLHPGTRSWANLVGQAGLMLISVVSAGGTQTAKGQYQLSSGYGCRHSNKGRLAATRPYNASNYRVAHCHALQGRPPALYPGALQCIACDYDVVVLLCPRYCPVPTTPRHTGRPCQWSHNPAPAGNKGCHAPWPLKFPPDSAVLRDALGAAYVVMHTYYARRPSG